MRLPSLTTPVETTDPRAALRLKTGLRSGGFRFGGSFLSQNQHYLNADESFDV